MAEDLLSGPAPSDYDAASIQVLEDMEHVRLRPGMYIGGKDDRALHHMVAEIVDNSMDEAVAGHATWIEIELHENGHVSVRDNGRGIPTDLHREEGVSAAEVIMTQLHAGGKFDQNSYKVSGGLHGLTKSIHGGLGVKLRFAVIGPIGRCSLEVVNHGNPQRLLSLALAGDILLSLERALQDRAQHVFHFRIAVLSSG